MKLLPNFLKSIFCFLGTHLDRESKYIAHPEDVRKPVEATEILCRCRDCGKILVHSMDFYSPHNGRFNYSENLVTGERTYHPVGE